MTQERINKYFNTELGQQLDELYSTSDDMVFIRYEEALKHTKGELNPDSKSLKNDLITTWYSPIWE